MIKINLLPQKKKMHIPKIPIGSILGLLILVGLGYYLWVMKEEEFNEQITQIEEEIKKKEAEKKRVLQDRQEKLSGLDTQINTYRQQINLIKRLIGSDMVAWSEVFEDMTVLVPKDTVWLKSFQCEGENKIVMQGVAKSDPNADSKKQDAQKIMTSISKFVENLTDCYYFSNIYLSNAQRAQMHGQDIYQFTLSAKIDRAGKKNAAKEGEATTNE